MNDYKFIVSMLVASNFIFVISLVISFFVWKGNRRYYTLWDVMTDMECGPDVTVLINLVVLIMNGVVIFFSLVGLIFTWLW